METSTSIIGLVLILITVFPIFLLLRNQHQNKNKIETILRGFNDGNSAEFSDRDTINNKIVAFNEQKKKIVLIDLNTKPEQVSYVDLNEISDCIITRETEHNDDSPRKKEFITKVELKFKHKADLQESVMKFYDFEYEKPIQITYYRDNQLAEKWLELIKKSI